MPVTLYLSLCFCMPAHLSSVCAPSRSPWAETPSNLPATATTSSHSVCPCCSPVGTTKGKYMGSRRKWRKKDQELNWEQHSSIVQLHYNQVSGICFIKVTDFYKQLSSYFYGFIADCQKVTNFQLYLIMAVMDTVCTVINLSDCIPAWHASCESVQMLKLLSLTHFTGTDMVVLRGLQKYPEKAIGPWAAA